MGCVDTKTQFNKQSRKNIQNNSSVMKAEQVPKEKKQDLQISDYDAFLKKSKEQGRTDYPTAFKFLKISPLSDTQLSKIHKEDISPLNCTRTQLINLAVQIITQNSFSKAAFNKSNIHSLITEIGNNYNSVSYHNFSHGFALMQMLYKCFKLDKNFGKFYSDQDLTYYLIAGITHDVNHKGTNNLYQVKLNTELAKTAQNDAVLQRMHLKTFLQICQKKQEFDVISKATNPIKIKQKITRAILATDMAKHFKNLEKITKHRNENKLNFEDEQIKIQYMQNLVHACDIGNALLPNEQYMTWGGLLTYEFNEQTKLEVEKNVPVTQFLRYKGINSFYDDQVGFIGTFVMPLWKEINVSFPSIKSMIQHLQYNIAKIKQLKQKQPK